MMQEKISSYSENPDYAIYGAIIQARDYGIIDQTYTIEKLDGGEYDIVVDGYQHSKPFYHQFFYNPYIDKVIVTCCKGVIINLGECTLAIRGYSIFGDIIECEGEETSYVVKLLSEPLPGMKLVQSNIKEEELQSVMHEYWAIQRLESELQNFDDKENYELIEFEDAYRTHYHLVGKTYLQTIVRAFKAKQEGEG